MWYECRKGRDEDEGRSTREEDESERVNVVESERKKMKEWVES